MNWCFEPDAADKNTVKAERNRLETDRTVSLRLFYLLEKKIELLSGCRPRRRVAVQRALPAIFESISETESKFVFFSMLYPAKRCNEKV